MVIVLTGAIASPAFSAPVVVKGTLIKTFNFGVEQFELDAVNHRLYATVPSTNSLAIIDTQNLDLLSNSFIGSNPFGLGLSQDGSRLYVGNTGSTVNAITAVDTQTRSVVGNFSLPVSAVDIAVGLNNVVYATARQAATSRGIMMINGLTGELLGEIAPRHSYSGGLLEISADRRVLIEQELGSSPSKAHKFNVNGASGSLQYSRETGSNGQDLAISHSGNFFAAPNGAPYDIRLFRVSDGAVLGTLDIGAYPREVTFSPDDLYAYAVHQQGMIDVFRTDTFLSTGPITITGEATELMVDETGQYLFASVGNQLRVYATGVVAVPEPSTLVLGGVALLMFGVYGRSRQRRRS